ncbi:MAG: hypothetical protein FJ403_22250 [Verrucomicrobia bacterium]|nr:hypothetical protein [Verrucomicrobiota bacterium]
MRWRIASDLHDEVGSNLSNIALLAHLGAAEKPASPRPRAEFAEINTVALQTANALRDLVWFINPECDTLDELVRQMEAVAQRLTPSLQVDFEAELQTGELEISLLFRRNVFFLYKEALHNALKHARAHHLAVRVRQKERILSVWIKDDGGGYDPQSVRRGHGLASMQRRADDLGGTLATITKPGQGSEIRLEAPLS